MKSMLSFYAMAALVLIAGAGSRLHAQWSDNPTANTVVSTAFSEQNYCSSASDGAGGVIVVWRDYRSGTNQDIYAQRLNAAGVAQWTANGVAICTATGNQFTPTITADGYGGAIIAWYDYRSGTNYDIYAQRVNAAGTVQWTVDGVAICTAAGNQYSPTIAADGSGGAIITWQDLRSASTWDIYAQRINAAGAVQWIGDGVAISTAAGNQASPKIVSDGAGGAIITWDDSRTGNNDVYAQRVNSGGAVQWTADGVAITSAANNQYSYSMATDGAGGAIITWYDYRSGTNYDIYAQRVNAAGAVQWTANGVAISTALNDQLLPEIVSDGAGGAIITWDDSRSGTDIDIYAQRVNQAGSTLWTENGVAISAMSNDQRYPQLVGDGAGGAIITWEDKRYNPYSDIYAQRINAAGAAQWAASGRPVATGNYTKQLPVVAGDGAGGAIIAWDDFRGYVDIFAQKVDASGLLGDGSVQIQAVKDVKYDQGGKVNVFWNASPYDVYGDYNPIYSYSVFRGVLPSSAGAKAVALPSNQYLSMKKKGTLASNYYLKGRSTQSSTDTIYWQWINDVTARKLNNYVYAAPTLADSTPQGIPMEYFMVTTNLSYDGSWISAPDSGYSVDNLPPSPVAMPTAQTQAGPSVFVHWHPDHSDPDVSSYELYRSTTNGFSPSPSTKIGQVIDSLFVDNSPAAGAFNYYRILTVDVHGNRSVPSTQFSAGVTGMVQFSVSDKWNMVSVPLIVGDYAKSVLYPGSVSNAFSYVSGSYAAQGILTNGTGYWVKFSGAQTVDQTGLPLSADTISVSPGWNMVGSVGSPISAAAITSVPPGIVTSEFFGYHGGYQASPTIDPGKAYWVKVNQAGTLVLAATAMESSENRIKIVSSDELPPALTDAPQAVTAIPTEFALQQNFPNPFNPATSIHYALPQDSYVRIAVYNALGQEVGTVVDGMQTAGYKDVRWSGGTQSSGLYIYRLDATSISDPSKHFSQVRKMLLIK
jgi:hypothetical protein